MRVRRVFLPAALHCVGTSSADVAGPTRAVSGLVILGSDIMCDLKSKEEAQ